MSTPLDHVRAIVADAPRCCNGSHAPGDPPCPGAAVLAAGGIVPAGDGAGRAGLGCPDLSLDDLERMTCARLAAVSAKSAGEGGDHAAGDVAAIVRALARGAQARAWLDAEDVIAGALADAGIRARADMREARAVLGSGGDGASAMPPCGDAHAHHAALLGIGRCPACETVIGMEVNDAAK